MKAKLKRGWLKACRAVCGIVVFVLSPLLAACAASRNIGNVPLNRLLPHTFSRLWFWTAQFAGMALRDDAGWYRKWEAAPGHSPCGPWTWYWKKPPAQWSYKGIETW